MLRNRSRVYPVILALTIALVVSMMTGCYPDHPMSTFDAKGPVAERQLQLFWAILAASTVVVILVCGAALYIVVKFRRRPGQGIPEQTHGSTKLEIAWTIAPIVLLAGFAIPTVAGQFYISAPPSDEPHMVIQIDAHQWWWDVKYPDSGVVTANEIHVPTNMNVKVDLTSADVLHSFWVPKLAGKMDIIPGKTTTMWFNASEAGEYYGQCAEFCGESHAWMRFRVMAVSPEEFESWTAHQLQDAPSPSTPEETAGSTLFLMKGCIACHAIAGNPVAAGIKGPNLTHVSGRSTLAAGIMEMNDANLRSWITDPEDVKPGNIMAWEGVAYTNPDLALTDADIDNLMAYIKSLR